MLARGNQACWQGNQALHRQGLAALNGRRLFSTEQPGMADRLKSAQQAASKVLTAPGRAAHSIRESTKSTSLVAYNQLPAPVSLCRTWSACLPTTEATHHIACCSARMFLKAYNQLLAICLVPFQGADDLLDSP